MELSPKQQAVNEIKKAGRILLLGNKKPGGDTLGSLLALSKSLSRIGKTIDLVVSASIDQKYDFLAKEKDIKKEYGQIDGKVIKIDTKKIPVSGMKWQKEDNFLNIYLDTDKNLKYEFIELVNGQPKPDLVVIVNTPDVEKIDVVYDKNTELFYEVPIINIDHHSGNEYYGTVNLIDLTATSTAEILVSLFEALGIKIDDTDTATALLSGIIEDTQSFRDKTTTPKSLTVAAQLLAAGARQQEIVNNFYRKNPVELMKAWGEMLGNLSEDKANKFAWTKIDTSNDKSIKKEDVFNAADDLLSNTESAKMVLILYKGAEDNDKVFGKLKGTKEKEVLSIAELFGGNGTALDAHFEISENNIDNAEKKIIKKIAENTKVDEEKQIWDVIEEEKIEKKESEDAIEEALKSISQTEKDENRKEFESIGEVIDRKRAEQEIDVFDEEE